MNGGGGPCRPPRQSVERLGGMMDLAGLDERLGLGQLRVVGGA
jgi:hypothetical protein